METGFTAPSDRDRIPTWLTLFLPLGNPLTFYSQSHGQDFNQTGVELGEEKGWTVLNYTFLLHFASEANQLLLMH